MPTTMTRTIQPVGQGGFYTEVFYSDDPPKIDFCTVYDCGSSTRSEPKKTIGGVLPDGADIDILFISHFDSDHVNGIKELAKNHKIKTVVMPQLEKYAWYYLIDLCIGKALSARNSESLISTFGETIDGLDAKIIEVEPFSYANGNEGGNGHESDASSNNSRPDNVRQQGRRVVRSGHIFSITDFLSSPSTYHGPDWLYVPINSADKAKIVDLKNRLTAIFHKGIQGFVNFETLAGSVCANFISSSRKVRTAIKNEYIAVFGNANSSSMCVYSGALDSTVVRFNNIVCGGAYYPFHYSFCGEYNSREACLYTGDANFNDQSLRDHIVSVLSVKSSDYTRLKRIGLMQIPHHGSVYSCSREAVEDFCKKGILKSGADEETFMKLPKPILFVSFGGANRYGHPSTYLLGALRASGYFVAEVTEKKDSTLYEIVEI